MDFSQAIKWYQSNPSLIKRGSHGLDSPLHKDFERRKKAHDMEGLKWGRYLVEGRVIEQRPEGIIISVHTTKTIQDGSVQTGAHQFTPNPA
jgi:hypothetical protein